MSSPVPYLIKNGIISITAICIGTVGVIRFKRQNEHRADIMDFDRSICYTKKDIIKNVEDRYGVVECGIDGTLSIAAATAISTESKIVWKTVFGLAILRGLISLTERIHTGILQIY